MVHRLGHAARPCEKLLRDLIAVRVPFEQLAHRTKGAAGAAPPEGKSASRVQPPIGPPSSFVITTIDGRGGTPSVKSGQRVAGFS
jgi:hypothetical protein